MGSRISCFDELRYISAQIFKFAYSALPPLFYSLFRIKSHHGIELYERKVLDYVHTVTVFEELASQNTDFRICIFCTSAVLFLV